MPARLCRAEVWISLSLILLTFAPLAQLLDHDFVSYDDPDYVTDNPKVKAGLTREGISWAFSGVHSANWHPLTTLSHMLDCHLFGLEPWGHHLTSLLFHLANTLFLFLVLKEMTASLWPSAFVAALFGLHPLHVESVAWISERKDVLSTFFWILTMAAYTRYSKQPRGSRYLWVLLAFLLGLLSKPMVITLPFVLLLLDFWPLRRLQMPEGPHQDEARLKGEPDEGGPPGPPSAISFPGPFFPRRSLSSLIAEKIPLILLSIASGLITLSVQKQGGALTPADLFPVEVRAQNALLATATYLLKMIWPADLAVFYPHPGHSPAPWKVIGASFLLLSVSAGILPLARRYPYLPVAWLWYLGTLVPVIGLIQVGMQAMADRYTYVPLIGPFILVAWGLPDSLARWPSRNLLLGLGGAAVILALMITTGLQARHWKGSVPLFEHALEVTENNFLIHSNLGAVLGEQGKIDEAITQYSKALRIRPSITFAQNNLGVLLARKGRLDEAAMHFLNVLQIRPDHPEAHTNLGNIRREQERFEEAAAHYAEAIRLKPSLVQAHNSLGEILAREGQYQEAIRRFSESIRFEPENPNAHKNLGTLLALEGDLGSALAHSLKALPHRHEDTELINNIGNLLLAMGRPGEAVAHYQEVLRLRPDQETAHYNLGIAWSRLRHTSNAMAHYRETLRLRPDHSSAHHNLALLLAEQGESSEAVSHYLEALRLQPDNAETHNNLGAALAKLEDFEKAIYHFSQALKLMPDYPEAHHNLAHVLTETGAFEQAVHHYRQALQLRPRWPAAARQLAWILATHPDPALRDGPEAVRLAEKARRDIDDPDVLLLDTLAAAYAEAHQFPSAIETALEALKLAQSSRRTHLAREIQARLELYRQNLPFRAP